MFSRGDQCATQVALAQLPTAETALLDLGLVGGGRLFVPVITAGFKAFDVPASGDCHRTDPRGDSVNHSQNIGFIVSPIVNQYDKPRNSFKVWDV